MYEKFLSSKIYNHFFLLVNCFDSLPLILHRLVRFRKKKLTIKLGYCPICDSRTIFIKFYDNEWGINCIKCSATPPILSFIGVLKKVVDNKLNRMIAFEMSSSGPLYKYLKKNTRRFYYSEFFEDIMPGSFKHGVQCQDVQRLTFKNNFFDLVTCTEVFEHVPDDIKGFSEIFRCLKPGGFFIFIVPLNEKPTVERAIFAKNKIIHKLEPEYHYNPLKSEGCLCLRNYGPDILDRLKKGGFKKVKIIQGNNFTGWGYSRYIIVARKEDTGFEAQKSG